MPIVCLGWGSLIWDPRELPISPKWETDGPELRVEFARQSSDGRITLVIAEEAIPVPVLWSTLSVDSLDDARQALAWREGISDSFLERSIGYWCPARISPHRESQQIGQWAGSRSLQGVVWTALKPRFEGKPFKPSCDQIISYLSELDEGSKRVAEKYIRNTPAQIRTSYRETIERELDWTAEPYGE